MVSLVPSGPTGRGEVLLVDRSPLVVISIIGVEGIKDNVLSIPLVALGSREQSIMF